MVNVENGTLQSAINNAAVGEVLMLTSDIVLTERVTVSNVVTIDLNGHMITGNIDDGYGAIYISTKGVLTIRDSSAGLTGGVSNNIGNAIGNYGIVNVYGGTFTGKYALYNFYYNNSIYGTSAIYGGTFRCAEANSPAVANCGDLTVSGGTIEYLDTTNVLTVTGGAVKSLYVGVADYNPEKQSTSISGGNITEFVVVNDSENNVAISGGTFATEVDSQYLSDGFKLTYDESTGSYGVVTDKTYGGLKVIATTSSRIRELVIKDGQLIFIQDLGRIAFDFKGKRVFYNQVVEIKTDIDRTNMENPMPGYYFVIDTACLWFYQDDWVPITEKPEEVIFIGVELPELGQAKENVLYVNKAEREISVYDKEEDDYIVVSNVSKEITIDDINSLFP